MVHLNWYQYLTYELIVRSQDINTALMTHVFHKYNSSMVPMLLKIILEGTSLMTIAEQDEWPFLTAELPSPARRFSTRLLESVRSENITISGTMNAHKHNIESYSLESRVLGFQWEW